MKYKSASIILFALFMLTLAGCKQSGKQVVSETAKQQLTLLPADAPIYGYVNFRRLHQAELSKIVLDSVQNMFDHNPALSHFRKQTGLNPREDIHELFFAGVLPDGRERPKGLIVALGTFNPDKIIAFITSKDKEKKLTRESYLKHTLLVAEEQGFALCFADSMTLLAGQVRQVKGWLKRKETQQLSDQSPLLKKLEHIKYPQGMWVSMDMAAMQERLKHTDLRKLNVLKQLNAFALSADVTGRIQFFATGIFSDAEQANLLRDAIKGVIAAGKLSVSNDRDVVDILNKIDVNADGNQISVDFKLNQDDIQKLLEKKKKLRKKMMPV